MLKRVFYGAAIQGALRRGERAETSREFIEFIRDKGFEVFSEHTTGRTGAETAALLEQSLGPMPEPGIKRSVFVRRKMIEAIESCDTSACIFEASIPSTGTGIEIGHAYLRPRLGLPAIPVLVLYETGYWPNGLTSMVRADRDEIPHLTVVEYSSPDEAKQHIADLLKGL